MADTLPLTSHAADDPEIPSRGADCLGTRCSFPRTQFTRILHTHYADPQGEVKHTESTGKAQGAQTITAGSRIACSLSSPPISPSSSVKDARLSTISESSDERDLTSVKRSDSMGRKYVYEREMAMQADRARVMGLRE